jgi:DnaJ-class molecular chaperone
MSRPISPEQYEPSWQEPDWETCPDCNGDAVHTVTRSRSGYLDEDVDVDCGTCEATGRVQS